MADSTQQQPRDPEQIRHDIEHTREELGDTVEALAHKTDVKARAKERVQRATPDSAGQAASTVGAKASQNRTPLIVGGVAAGAFVAGWALGRR